MDRLINDAPSVDTQVKRADMSILDKLTPLYGDGVKLNTKKILSGPMIHICFLEAEHDDEGLRPVISKSIDELGITFEQAIKVCEELNGHKTIAAWMTSSKE